MLGWAHEILTDGQWAGEPAFVVGGGDSIRYREFDLQRLERFHTIAVNTAWRYFRPEVVYLADPHLLQLLEGDHADEWYGLRCPKLVHQSTVNEQRRFGLRFDGCHLLRIAKSSVEWGQRLEEGLCGGNNSGVIALNLAEVLGADPIFLVGFDCRLGPGGRKNFHDDYPGPESGHHWDAPRNDEWFDRFVRHFQERAKPHLRAKVYNGEDSRIEAFERISYSRMVEIAAGRRDCRTSPS